VKNNFFGELKIMCNLFIHPYIYIQANVNL